MPHDPQALPPLGNLHFAKLLGQPLVAAPTLLELSLGRWPAAECLASVVARFPVGSKLDLTRVNPQTGPFYVEGAEPDDTLQVHIDSIEQIVSERRNHCSQQPSTDFCNKIGTQRGRREVAVATALGCAEDEICEPSLHDPNPTFGAIRRTVELVGKGNPLQRG